MGMLLLLVIHHSLSLGLGAIPDECADALRSLTGNVFERTAITHVSTIDFAVARTLAEPELAPVPRAAAGLAYTVQGPRNEVAIVVCAPAVESPPAPASTSGLAPGSTADGVTGS
jgi:hypothetical protein